MSDELLTWASEGIALTTWKEPTWEWRLAERADVVFRVNSAPNWFHRHMQRLFLGIIWKRL